MSVWKKVVTSYVDNTGAAISDTIEEPDPTDPTGQRLQRMHLAGLVTGVQFMAQDEETGTIDVSIPATTLESSDPATWGDVEVFPTSPSVASEKRRVAWWRLTFNDGKTLDTAEFLWLVQPHGVAATGTAQPTMICQAWATNADIARYTPAAEDADYTPWLIEASEILYALSAEQFPGICRRVVRPIAQSCGCWQVLSRGHIVLNWEWIGSQWWAENMASQPGCGMLSQVRLAGGVVAINNVKIGGVVVDPTTYRVDQGEWLVRLHDPVTGQPQAWPACQDLSLADDQPGTFSVDYNWGAMPPLTGIRAAAALAWQLYLAENPTGREKCQLPAGWTSVSRQGVTLTRDRQTQFPVESGLVEIDGFLGTYNPGRLSRQPTVYSRDVQPYAQRYG